MVFENHFDVESDGRIRLFSNNGDTYLVSLPYICNLRNLDFDNSDIHDDTMCKVAITQQVVSEEIELTVTTIQEMYYNSEHEIIVTEGAVYCCVLRSTPWRIMYLLKLDFERSCWVHLPCVKLSDNYYDP